MKLRRAGWWALLVATHGAVFLAARPVAGPARAGGGEGTGQAANAPAPAKAALREADGRRENQRSLHGNLLAELNASDLEGVEYEEAVLAIFREWIKRDLRGALRAIHGAESGKRYAQAAMALSDELQAELAAQSRQVEQWIAGMEFGSRHAEVAELWAAALVAAGRREDLLAALPELPGKSQVAVIDLLCETAKGPELAILRQWMAPGSQENLDEYAERVMRFAGDDAERVLSGEGDPQVQAALAEAYLERYITDRPPLEALAASRKLPGEYRWVVLRDQIAGSAGVEGFTAVLAEMERQGLWQEFANHPEAELIESAIDSTCDAYSLPGEVFRELSGIARPELRLATLRTAATKMGALARPDAVAGLVPSLPKGEELDAFIEGLAEVGVGVTAETWTRVLDCVSNPELRERLKEERGDLEESVAEEES